MKQEC